MDCTTCQELFSEYADQQLNTALVPTIESHLDRCPLCAREWDYFQKTVVWLRTLPPLAPPVDLQSAIAAKIAAKTNPPPLLQRFWKWLSDTDFSMSLPHAAATVGVALLVMLLVKNTPPTPQADKATPTARPPQITDQHPTNRLRPRGVTSPHPAWSQRSSVIDDSIAALSTTPSLDFIVGRPTRTTANPAASFYPQRELTSRPPDMVIAVHNSSFEERLRLCRTLLTSRKWTADIFNADTVFVEIDPCRLKALHKTLAGRPAEISPPIAKHAAFGAPKKALTVAIVLQ